MTRRVAVIATASWLPLAVLLWWWYATKDGSSIFFPPLSSIWEAIKANWLFERVTSDLFPSLKLFGLGYLLAAVVGITLGTALGMWPLGRRATLPLIDFLRAIPAPAVISVLVILLGFEQTMKLTVITFTASFPVLLNTIDGVRGVSPELLDMATVYKLRRRDRIFRLILPAASPQIFAGLRISLAVALAVLVFAEMLAGTNGLGYFIVQAQTTYQIPNMWSGIIVLGLIGYLVNIAFVLAEGRIMRWHRGWRAHERNAGGER
jgi:sulfonate transport system permease protein